MPDEPRFLSRGSVPGYVSHASAALPGEPEALSEDEQLAMSARAHEKALNARIERRQATAGDVQREVDHLEGRLRYLRRQLKRLQRVAS